MGLKKATIEYTDRFGNVISRTLTIKSVVFLYEDQKIEVI